jgi:ribosomal protein S27AE
MAQVITGTAKRKGRKPPPVAVRKAGHPAAFRKVRCPKCKQGYAVQDNVKKGEWLCGRCGSVFTQMSI